MANFTLQTDLYTYVVKTLGVGIYIFRLEDLDDIHSFQIIEVNDTASQISNREPGSLVGRQLEEALPSVYETRLPEIYANVIRTQQGINLGVIEHKGESVEGFFEVKATPLPEQCVLITFDNVTQRKKAQEKLSQRAVEVETIAQVSAAVEGVLDMDELLNKVADLTKERFDLYHAHIYLLDDTEENLILAAGAGEAGRTMKARGHKIPLNREHSLVASAARGRKGVRINDVSLTPDFMPNPLLPETRSEMAIPIIASERLLGVLDVQSEKLNRFEDEDIQVKTILAEQIAVAIQNARTFEELKTVQQEVTRIITMSRDLIGTAGFDGYFKDLNPAWETTLGFKQSELLASPFIDFVHPDDRDKTNAEAAKLAQGYDAISFDNRYRCKDGSYKWISWNAVPDPAQGKLYFVARDITESKRAAEETQTLYNVSSKLTQARTPQELLEIVSEYAAGIGAVSAMLLYLENDNNNVPVWAETVAVSGNSNNSPIGSRYYLPEFPYSQFWISSPDKPSLIEDISTYEQIDPSLRTAYARTGMRGSATLPLHVGTHWLGVISFNWTTTHQFTQEEQRILSILSQQATAVIETLRTNQEMEKRANELETVALVSAASSKVLDVDQMLQSVVDLTKANFHLYHAHIYLLDDAGKNLVLAAGAGEVGRIMKTEGRSIPINHPNSIVAHTAQSGKGMITNDVSASPDFLPNPLLPDTRSEMALPMIVGDKVIGVLDVQSEKLNRFTQDDVKIKTILAAQIAVAVQNARAYEQIVFAQNDLEANRTQLRGILDNTTSVVYLKEVPTGKYLMINKRYEELFHVTMDQLVDKTDYDLFPKELADVLAVNDRSIVDTRQAQEMEESVPQDDGIHTYVTVKFPLTNKNGEVYAVGGISTDITNRKQAEEEALTLYDISSKLTGARTPEEMLEAVINYAQSLGMTIANLMSIESDEAGTPVWAEMVANWAINPESNIPLGTRFYLPEFPFAKVLLNSEDKPTLSNDITIEPALDPTTRAIYEQLGSRASVTIPLHVNSRWLGIMSFNSDKPYHFTEQHQRIFSVLGQQASAVLDTIMTAKETEKRANELETVALVSATSSKVLDVDQMLQSVVDLTKASFHLYHAHIYLLDDAGENLVLASGAGEIGRIMKTERRAIPVSHPNSIVARTARRGEGVITNDVSASLDFLPNPLLPDTRSEMAIPMIVGGMVIGVLDVQSETLNRFTKDDVKIKTILAAQIAVAVQNARQYQTQVETTERLREVDRLKSDFLASMSHELRTPLNSIIGYSRILIDDEDDISDDAKEDLSAIYNSGQHLLNLINDILDLAKIEAGRLELDLEDVDLNGVLTSVRQMTSVLLMNKPVALVIDAEENLPHLYADPIRLKQILNNLVSNAIKFTERGEIRITVTRLVDQNSVQLAVKDTGIGIQPEQLNLVFERFRQVDSSSKRKASGTGMGLTITKLLAEMHGGRIWVESEYGKGTTFFVEIPITASNQ